MTQSGIKRTVVIADDEPLARQRLVDLLSGTSAYEVVAETSNGEETVEAVRRRRPDLLFLDVRMPNLGGLEVLDALRGAPWPALIFVTAHSEFALRAFDVSAVDYLLKPFSIERFKQALEKVDHHLSSLGPSAPGSSGSRNALDRRSPPRFSVPTRNGFQLVPSEEVNWIEAEGNYSRLHTDHGRHFIRETMSSLEARLDSTIFVRVHRSAIVNLERIHRIETQSYGAYRLVLRSGEQVMTSRSYGQRLRSLFS